MHPSDVPDIRARELLTVMALAEYGSFVAAAAYLKTSQPALTRTIKRVERVLGVTLFARNTRRVEITAAGREFVAVAERMLNDLQLTVRNLSEVTNEQRGRITLSTYSAFAVNPLPDARAPLPRDAAARSRSGFARAGSRRSSRTCGAASPTSASATSTRCPTCWRATSLRKEPLYVLIPPSHPLAREEAPARPPGGAARRAARLARRATRTCAGWSTARGLSAGFTLHYSVTVDRLLSVLHHVCAGVGIGILPSGVPAAQIQWGEGFHAAHARRAVAVGDGRADHVCAAAT